MHTSLPLNILNNHSFFQTNVPKSIGKPIWYSSSLPIEQDQWGKSTANLKIAIAIVLVILSWIFLFSVSIYLPIIITVGCIIWGIFIFESRIKSDYIIGESGFSIINFKNSRNNLIDIKTVLFKDVAYTFLGETKIYEDKKYNRTEYVFSLYSPLKSETNSYNLLFSKSGSFIEDDCFENLELKFFPDYLFVKELEEILNNRFIKEHSNCDTVEFIVVDYALHHNTIINKAIDAFVKSTGIAAKSLSRSSIHNITLSRQKLIIDSIEYDLSCLKYAGIDKGFLVVEHENHKRKALGLIEKGDIHSIQLNGLGNMRAFVAMLKHYLST